MSEETKKGAALKIAGIFLLAAIWPAGIFGLLVGIATSSVILGILTYIVVFWANMHGQQISSIHKWVKRINESTRFEEAAQPTEQFRIGKYVITKEK